MPVSDCYKSAWVREKKARQIAERLLEDKSRQMYLANKQLEASNAELNEKQRALVQSEKMASIGILASGVAHEINNPVGFCLSNVDVLRDYIQSIAQHPAADELDFIMQDSEALIEETLEGLQRVADIVKDLQGFARKSEDDCKPVNINDVLKSTLNMLNHKVKYIESVQLVFAELPLISTNASKLHQIFLNIILNAIQAVEERSEVSIATERIGEFVLTRVKDNGCGISEDDIDKIFTPFFTTKKVGEGTGLGLSVTYSLVQELGGDIQVLSDPGRGTEFTVSLPITTQAALGDTHAINS
jgi:C4-dicarboxylate-specific signal transduction histidine kinase